MANAHPPSTAVVIENVTKTYPPQGGATSPTVAVDNVSLRVEPGELFFLLGPSGCGKTTLLRMIAGFIEATSGKISYNTAGTLHNLTSIPPEKRDIGMVFQSYALWPHMTVAQNVGFGLEMRTYSSEERTRLVYEALSLVKMSDYANRKPVQLSGGQQQRVALARALVIKPKLLLLDEPLSNLDARLRAELRVEIRRVCKATGITAIYVTHDQKEALSIADRIAIMQNGTIEQIGTPKEVYYAPLNRFVAEFLGELNTICDPCVSRETGDCSQTVSFRPEDVAIMAMDDSIPLPGTCYERHFFGDTTEYHSKTAHGIVTASVPSRSAGVCDGGKEPPFPLKIWILRGRLLHFSGNNRCVSCETKHWTIH